ncbi:MAG: phytanoyl-CoA dioxygenase family protein [Actinomycetota bacterium]|nr:phytanoyl-CoA dioxygenase family protein [Actinomycetota bacterium]
MTFSQTQVRSYVDDGFVIVPGLLGADEVEELKADTIRLARGTYPCPGNPPRKTPPTTMS